MYFSLMGVRIYIQVWSSSWVYQSTSDEAAIVVGVMVEYGTMYDLVEYLLLSRQQAGDPIFGPHSRIRPRSWGCGLSLPLPVHIPGTYPGFGLWSMELCT